MTTTADLHLTQLQTLEAESVHVLREVAAELERPVLLFSGGKDSIVMLHLAVKAFWPARIPFPLVHVDTGHNFDEVREFLSRGLGFSREDRDTNVLRIGWVAATLAKHGVLVLASVISPYAETRAGVRELHERKGAGFLEVHVATPVEVCRRRDVKGLYARQRAGQLQGLTGVDAPYEAPSAPDARIPTQEQSLDESVDQLLALLVDRGLVEGATA